MKYRHNEEQKRKWKHYLKDRNEMKKKIYIYQWTYSMIFSNKQNKKHLEGSRKITEIIYIKEMDFLIDNKRVEERRKKADKKYKKWDL